MKKLIKTLSLAGYINRKNRDGYAVALCLPDGEDFKPYTLVLEQFTDSSNYPEDTRVNVATGVITAPRYLRGIRCLKHSNNLKYHNHPATGEPLYIVLSIRDGNEFLRTAKRIHELQ